MVNAGVARCLGLARYLVADRVPVGYAAKRGSPRASESICASRCRQQQVRRKAAGRVGPGGVVGGSSCYERSLGGLNPEVGETHQFERVGVPLGEQVVHFRMVFVVGHAVVRDADASLGFTHSMPAARHFARWQSGGLYDIATGSEGTFH